MNVDIKDYSFKYICSAMSNLNSADFIRVIRDYFNS